MPRRARIDAPGAVHHIVIFGIERKAIFKGRLATSGEEWTRFSPVSEPALNLQKEYPAGIM